MAAVMHRQAATSLRFRRQLRRLTDGFHQAFLVGDALAGNVERRTVIDTGADNWKANGNVDACVQAEHFDGTMS